MSDKPRALVTGITGQDGHYLTKLLLEKGYEVHGFARRGARLPEGVQSHVGDLQDPAALRRAIIEAWPHEIYNLGAQSHVQASFLDPDYTFHVTALPLFTILEQVKDCKRDCRVYQSSSSEMFGDAPPPQNENSPFRPRSPYAIAKVAAHHAVRLYRESKYGLFAVGGILHNHECVTAETPVVIRKHGLIDILPIEEVVTHREAMEGGGQSKYTTEPKDLLEVWDRDGWTQVKCMTATRAKDRGVIRLHARAALITATPEHVVFVGGDGQEREAGTVESGHCLTLGSVPSVPGQTSVTAEEAWLVGALIADGYVAEDGRAARFTKNDERLRNLVAAAWMRVAGGWTNEGETSSGFSENMVKTVNLHGVSQYKKWLRQEIYTEKGFKRIPRRVLNSDAETQLAFLRGYNVCDGLKEGHGTNEFKSWKTNSPTLAAGLWWMAQTVLKQRTILCVEDRDEFTYYTINLNVPEWMNSSGRGAHRRRPLDEVVKVERRQYTGWLFDLATESGTFHAGVGQAWIHNSPRRPHSFVTRKITSTVAAIFKGEATELVLGNLDAKRDWGFAGDYVMAMWLMLQQDAPKDFVIATGNTHSVREFVQEAFRVASEITGVAKNWQDYVKTDPRFERPAEVPLLLGNATRACEELGWAPKVGFEGLVRMMVEHDLRVAGWVPQPRLRGADITLLSEQP